MSSNSLCAFSFGTESDVNISDVKVIEPKKKSSKKNNSNNYITLKLPWQGDFPCIIGGQFAASHIIPSQLGPMM